MERVPFFNKRYARELAFYQNVLQKGNKGVELRDGASLSKNVIGYSSQAGGGLGWDSGKTCSPCVDSSADKIHIFSQIITMTRLHPISTISRFNQTLMLINRKVKKQVLLQLL